MQIGLYPQGHSDVYWAQIAAGELSGYANAGADFEQGIGSEGTHNYRTHVENAEQKAYYRIYYRLRAGGHHTIITLHDTDVADGWVPGTNESASRERRAHRWWCVGNCQARARR